MDQSGEDKLTFAFKLLKKVRFAPTCTNLRRNSIHARVQDKLHTYGIVHVSAAITFHFS